MGCVFYRKILLSKCLYLARVGTPSFSTIHAMTKSAKAKSQAKAAKRSSSSNERQLKRRAAVATLNSMAERPQGALEYSTITIQGYSVGDLPQTVE